MPIKNGANGVLLAFHKVHSGARVFERLVALATRGPHFHVECVFCTRKPRDHVFMLEPVYWTSFMGQQFQSHALRVERYRADEWDLVFVPLDEAGVSAARNWVEQQEGKPYDFVNAFSSPFRCMHLSRPRKHPREESALFCSEAALRVLQEGGALPGVLTRLAADACSPEALFDVLRDNGCERVAHARCGVLPQWLYNMPQHSAVRV